MAHEGKVHTFTASGSFNRAGFQAREMAQWVECWPHTHEDLSFDPQNPCKVRCTGTDLKSQSSCSKTGSRGRRIHESSQDSYPGVNRGEQQRNPVSNKVEGVDQPPRLPSDLHPSTRACVHTDSHIWHVDITYTEMNK